MNRQVFSLLFLSLLFNTFNLPAAELTGEYVNLPKVQLWIIDSGGEGEAIILLHPRTGNSQFWQNTIPALAEAGYRAIAIDNPGWGKSRVDDPKNPDPVAVTLSALINELGLDRVHVVGTAMGGYVALDYAAAYPEQTRSLV
nr:alpha/beta fold hydrolase [Gammaproteobacteria bacterium]